MNREAREHEDRNPEILKAFAHCFHKVLPFCCSQASFRHLKSNELMDVRVDPEIVSSAKHVFSADRRQREDKWKIITHFQRYQAGPGPRMIAVQGQDESTLPPTFLITLTDFKFDTENLPKTLAWKN
jgi:hypothetical protein